MLHGHGHTVWTWTQHGHRQCGHVHAARHCHAAFAVLNVHAHAAFP
jgi:hypothetical protein